jgi:hypothetical protein
VLALDNVRYKRAAARRSMRSFYAGVASSVQMRSMLYTAATIVPASRVRRKHLKRVRRNPPKVFIQPKISWTSFRLRWLIT